MAEKLVCIGGRLNGRAVENTGECKVFDVMDFQQPDRHLPPEHYYRRTLTDHVGRKYQVYVHSQTEFPLTLLISDYIQMMFDD